MAWMNRQSRRERRENEISDACLAHTTHDDPKAHAGECGFCNQIVSDAEHRAYLDATPGAWEHHHGAA